MELQQWKQNFIRDYLDEIDSLEVMDKLEKYTKRILNKKPVALSPIAFNIDEANAEIVSKKWRTCLCKQDKAVSLSGRRLL